MKKPKYEAQDFTVEWRPCGKKHRIPRHSHWSGYLVSVWADEFNQETGECFWEVTESFPSWEKALAFIMRHGIDKATAVAMRPASSIRRK